MDQPDTVCFLSHTLTVVFCCAMCNCDGVKTSHMLLISLTGSAEGGMGGGKGKTERRCTTKPAVENKE